MFMLILTAEFSVRALETNSRWLLIESHVHLFAGDLGMQVVRICGLLLLLISVTGLILWTGWKVCYWLQNSLEISLATGQLRSPQVGYLVRCVAFLIAFTGAAMIFLDSV